VSNKQRCSSVFGLKPQFSLVVPANPTMKHVDTPRDGTRSIILKALRGGERRKWVSSYENLLVE